MSMNNKQRWMGAVVLLGGGVLLAAMLIKGKNEIENVPPTTSQQQAQVEQPADSNEMVQLQELSVDVETEKRLLEEQRKARERAVAEQEARAAEFLAMQQQAEADAARKAAEEYAALMAKRQGSMSSDNIPPELVEDEAEKAKRVAEEKAKAEAAKTQSTEQQRLAEEKKKAEEKQKTEAEQKRLAEEKKRKEEAKKAESEKQRVEEQKKADEKRKQEEKKAEEKRKAEEKNKADAEQKRVAEEKKRKEEEAKKAEAEKARKLLEEGDKNWMVQVALAANQANADAMVAKLRAKGFKVVTSQTSKGIRVMVGPEKDREKADLSRKKINADPSLNMKGAWVIDWVPLDQR